jgi:hypothetical protein
MGLGVKSVRENAWQADNRECFGHNAFFGRFSRIRFDAWYQLMFQVTDLDLNTYVC